MRRTGLCLAGLVLALGLRGSASGATYSVTVSDTDAQKITGWGVFPDQCGSTNADRPLVYDAIRDLGVTSLRFRLWPTCAKDAEGDINPGTADVRGLEHIYYIWDECRKRGITDWTVSVWHVPTQMAEGNHLPQANEGAFCTYIVNCFNYFINSKGMPPPLGFCVCNEPGDQHAWANPSYEQVERVTLAMRAKFDGCGIANIAGIPLVEDDANSYKNFVHFGSYSLTNPAFWKAVGIVSSHSYKWGDKMSPTGPDIFVEGCEKYAPGKERWMTELCNDTDPQPTQFLRASKMCQQLALDINYCGMSQWYWWSMYDNAFAKDSKGGVSFGSIDSPHGGVLVDGNGVTELRKSKTYTALAKLWNSAKKGSAVRKVTSTDPAFKAGGKGVGFFADGCAFNYQGSTILMLINDTAAAKTYDLNGLTGSSAAVYQMTETQDMEAAGKMPVTGGKIADFSLPANSIVILTTGA